MKYLQTLKLLVLGMTGRGASIRVTKPEEKGTAETSSATLWFPRHLYKQLGSVTSSSAPSPSSVSSRYSEVVPLAQVLGLLAEGVSTTACASKLHIQPADASAYARIACCPDLAERIGKGEIPLRKALKAAKRRDSWVSDLPFSARVALDRLWGALPENERSQVGVGIMMGTSWAAQQRNQTTSQALRSSIRPWSSRSALG